MAFSKEYLEFLIGQFDDFGGVSHKKMFGGVGFYREDLMFGGIMGGELHLKVDDESRPVFEEKGMTPFFHSGKKKSMPTYYLVPSEIVEDKKALTEWSRRAFEAALRSSK